MPGPTWPSKECQGKQTSMSVSFSMKSICGEYSTEYKAPIKPEKPSQDDWTNKEEKMELKKKYRREISEWKTLLRPVPGSKSLGVPTLPEAVKPYLC